MISANGARIIGLWIVLPLAVMLCVWLMTGNTWVSLICSGETIILLWMYYTIRTIIEPYLPVADGKVHITPAEGDVMVPVRCLTYMEYETYSLYVNGVRAASLHRGNEILLPVPPGPAEISLYLRGRRELTMDVTLNDDTSVYLWIDYKEVPNKLRAACIGRKETFDESEIKRAYLSQTSVIDHVIGLIKLIIFFVPGLVYIIWHWNSL